MSSNLGDSRVTPNATQLKELCRSTNPELMLCRHPAGAENLFDYPLSPRLPVFAKPTPWQAHGATICRPLRGLNNKRCFTLFYYSLRRRCNNVAQRRKPWENKYLKKITSPRRVATLKLGGIRITPPQLTNIEMLFPIVNKGENSFQNKCKSV
jgi:hypothetical protein